MTINELINHLYDNSSDHELINRLINICFVKTFNCPQAISIHQNWVNKQLESFPPKEILAHINQLIKILINNQQIFNEFKLQLKYYFHNDYDIDIQSVIDYINNSVFYKKLKGFTERIISWTLHQFNQKNHLSVINDVKELLTLDLPLNKPYDTGRNFKIDYINRDFPFIYINDEYIEGKNTDIHTDLLKKYFKEHDIKGSELLENKHIRSLNDLPQLEDTSQISFGHIYKNIAFIETCINVDEETVSEKIKQKHNNIKVFIYDYVNNNITRLARKVINNDYINFRT